jgi:hypothetical protein
MRDDEVHFEYDFLDTGSVMFKIFPAIFVPGPTAPGIGVIITKLDVAHQVSEHLQPILALLPKAS